MNDSNERPKNIAEASRITPHIQEKIDKLRTLETKLGHLPPDEISLKELNLRMEDPKFTFQSKQLEQQTELLFGDICDELSDLGFSPSQIANVVNSNLRYEGGPMYCNAAEVKECLGLAEDDQ